MQRPPDVESSDIWGFTFVNPLIIKHMDVIVKPYSTINRVRWALAEANGGFCLKPEGMVFEVDDFNSFLHIVWRAYAKISREADGWMVIKIPLVVAVGRYLVKIKPEVVNGVTGLRYGVVD